jgi:hypothetical protein
MYKRNRGKQHHTYNKTKEGHILRRKCFLNHVIEGDRWGWDDEEEDVICYRMTLRKQEDSGKWKRKHLIALRGELAFEDVMDLTYDRIRDDET